MRSVSSKLYDKDYYLHVCLGSKEFQKSHGTVLHSRLQALLQDLPITSSTNILDIGCGRGDIVLHLAKKAYSVTGIDYSRDAIAIANQIKKKFPKKIQEKVSFRRMNARKLQFADNSFDLILCIDVLEHLYKDEAELAMKEISRVLKPQGVFFVHTGPNKLLNDVTYPLYILPMNKLLTKIDQLFKGKKYTPLPNNPRTEEEEQQHVNEPTFFYLKNLYNTHSFSGKIRMETGYIKPVTSTKTVIYNALIAWYPVSRFFPLNLLFGWNFISLLRNEKKSS